MAALASTIRQSNGYETDAGALVFVGEAPPLGPDDPDQALAIVPENEATQWQEPGLAVDVILPIGVHGVTKVDATNAWLGVEAMIRDIKRAIETSDVQFSGLLSWPLERGPVLTLGREAGSANAGAAVMYRARLKEGWGRP